MSRARGRYRFVQSVPAPPRVVMVAPPTVPRNAEGAQSERPRCLTGARQNNAANNTRIIKARPGHPEGYPGLRAIHDPTGQLPRIPIPRTLVNKAKKRAEAARDIRPSHRGLT